MVEAPQVAAVVPLALTRVVGEEEGDHLYRAEGEAPEEAEEEVDHLK